MASMLIRLNVALAGVVLSTSIVSSQQQSRPNTLPQAPRQYSRDAVRAIESLINGTAIDPDRKPLPHADIRLRNLQSNQVVQTVTTNKSGEFSFVATPGVAYVVEVADRAGQVLAVSDVVVANAGEVAGALVALPFRLPALTVFTDTASSVRSAATRAGLLVVDPILPKLSPSK